METKWSWTSISDEKSKIFAFLFINIECNFWKFTKFQFLRFYYAKFGIFYQNYPLVEFNLLHNFHLSQSFKTVQMRFDKTKNGKKNEWKQCRCAIRRSIRMYAMFVSVAYYSSTFSFVRRKCKTKLVFYTHVYIETAHKYMQTSVLSNIYSTISVALVLLARAWLPMVVSVWCEQHKYHRTSPSMYHMCVYNVWESEYHTKQWQ